MSVETPNLNLPKYTEYYPNDYYLLRKFAEAEFLTLDIPFPYLTGRQTIDEFPQRKQRNIKRAFARYGQEVLERDPIITCAVPTHEGILIVILDGHNRTRFAPTIGISHIKCYVYNLEVVASIFEKTAEETKKELLSQVNEARHSFGRKFEGRYRGFGYIVPNTYEHGDLLKNDTLIPFEDRIGRFAKK